MNGNVTAPDSAPKVKLNSQLNFTDAKGKRQGKWVIYGKISGDAAYGPTDKVEEGNYVDGEKEGVWKEYNPGEKLKREVYYKSGKEVSR